MFNTLLHTTVVCPITPTGYIYMPMQSSVYSVALTSNIAPSGTYLLRDILAGSPPQSGIVPVNPPEFYGLEFILGIVNNTGRDITFIFADNSTPGILTYFSFQGDGKYVIHPYSVLRVQGVFINNSLIMFYNVYNPYIDLRQYGQVITDAINNNYLSLSLTRRSEYKEASPPLTISGNTDVPIDINTLSLHTSYYGIMYNGSGTITISGNPSQVYLLIVISVSGGTPTLMLLGTKMTLSQNMTYFIGITKGNYSVTIVPTSIDLNNNSFQRLPLYALSEFGVKGIEYQPIKEYVDSRASHIIDILDQ